MKSNDILLLEQAYQKVIIEQITDDWFKEGSFIAYKKPAKEPFEIAKQSGTLQTLEGPQQYKEGFYIITGPKGEKYSMPPEKFKELKEDNGDGTASPKKINKYVKLADSDGKVKTSWGAELEYKTGEDYIVKHGVGDYGVVKKDIFNQTYVTVNKPLEEGIWDRVKGLGSGIKAGASILGQNLKDKAVTALGGTPQQRSGETVGQAYAKAQQGSLKNSFIKKATKEIEDFKNDLKVMGIKQTDTELRSVGLTEIADKLKAMEDLVNFLQTQKSNPSPLTQSKAPTNTPQQQTVPNTQTSSTTHSNTQQTTRSSQRQRNAKGQFISNNSTQPVQNNTQQQSSGSYGLF